MYGARVTLRQHTLASLHPDAGGGASFSRKTISIGKSWNDQQQMALRSKTVLMK